MSRPQLPGNAPGIMRRDRHHPRGRPGDLDDEPAAAPGDVAAAQRHKLTGPQPGPDTEHHYRQRRGAFRRVTLGRRDGGQLGALGRRVRRGGFCPPPPRCPPPPPPPPPPRPPGPGRPAGGPGGGPPAPPAPPALPGPYIQWTRTVNGKTVTRTLTQSQYDAYAGWFANARRLRSLTAELEALSLQEMARAEGWARIPPGTQAPARTKLVRAPKHPKTPGDQPA